MSCLFSCCQRDDELIDEYSRTEAVRPQATPQIQTVNVKQEQKVQVIAKNTALYPEVDIKEKANRKIVTEKADNMEALIHFMEDLPPLYEMQKPTQTAEIPQCWQTSVEQLLHQQQFVRPKQPVPQLSAPQTLNR